MTGQLGLEATPEEYVANLVAVFREVWRVLRPDGTLWLNLGDRYAGSRRGPEGDRSGLCDTRSCQDESRKAQAAMGDAEKRPFGLQKKNLIGLPWRVAFALQADGWCLRSDIIWHKPNAMPEAAADRCTNAHEYLFMLAKQRRYFFDAAAIREPSMDTGRVNGRDGRVEDPRARPPGTAPRRLARVDYTARGRDRRDVWSICPQPYPGDHFAVMPEALVEPCLLAGSAKGDTVLDPFIGTGTVAVVAWHLGRHAIGIDLNPGTIEQASHRPHLARRRPRSARGESRRK